MNNIKRINYELAYSDDIRIKRQIKIYLNIYEDDLDLYLNSADNKISSYRFMDAYLREIYGSSWLTSISSKVFCSHFVEYYNYWTLLCRQAGVLDGEIITWDGTSFVNIETVINEMPDSYPSLKKTEVASLNYMITVKVAQFQVFTRCFLKKDHSDVVWDYDCIGKWNDYAIPIKREISKRENLFLIENPYFTLLKSIFYIHNQLSTFKIHINLEENMRLNLMMANFNLINTVYYHKEYG